MLFSTVGNNVVDELNDWEFKTWCRRNESETGGCGDGGLDA